MTPLEVILPATDIRVGAFAYPRPKAEVALFACYDH